MQLLRGSRSEKIDNLITVALVLGMLLSVLVAWTLFGNVLGILGRFYRQILMFIIGALLAYIMIPLVALVQRAVKKRWAAIAGSYLLIFLAFMLVAFLLVNPFISQAHSLSRNLQHPAATSLQPLQAIRSSTRSIQTILQYQQKLAGNRQGISSQMRHQTQEQIAALQRELSGLSTGAPPPGQSRIPASYVASIRAAVNRSAAEYRLSGPSSGPAERQALERAVKDARAAVSAADSSYKQAGATPIVLLDAQTWLDTHGIGVNLHDRFGDALQQVSKQLSSILGNALGIALQTGNLFVTAILVLIISVYFISDGARFVNWCMGLAPAKSRPRVRFFVSSLDQILGTQVRTGVLMAALAGTLDATGAVLFGVPYAIVIFFSSFLLSMVPIIGPVVLYIPPMIIALIFTSLPTPLFYLVWLLVGEQLVTNVIGPRVAGHNFGIHPLEAMAAALVGYPIAGFLGAFFAVPAVSFLHLVAREAVRSGQHAGADVDAAAPAEAPPSEPIPAGGNNTT